MLLVHVVWVALFPTEVKYQFPSLETIELCNNPDLSFVEIKKKWMLIIMITTRDIIIIS